jgi:hypothetical protein
MVLMPGVVQPVVTVSYQRPGVGSITRRRILMGHATVAIRPRGTGRTPSARRGLRRAVLRALALAPLALAASACSIASEGILPVQGSSTAARPSATPSVVPPTAVKTGAAAKVIASGWGQAAGSTWVSATLHGDGSGAESATVTFTAFGTGGRVLAFGTSAAVQITRGQTTAVGTLLDVPPGEAVVRLQTDVKAQPLPRPREARYVIGGVNVQARDQGQPRLLATLTTPQSVPTLVTAVCTDRAGRILGGGATALGTTAAGGLRAFAVDPLVVPTLPARCSVYTAVTTG